MEQNEGKESILDKFSTIPTIEETSKVFNNGPTNLNISSLIPNISSTAKPVLIRQDRTYLASPQLSATGANLGGSEESNDDIRIDERIENRSAPDIFQNFNHPSSAFPQISISDNYDNYDDEDATILSPLPKCRTCRRSSTSPTSIIYLDRSTSKESVVHGHLKPHLLVHHHSTTIPPVFLTTGSPSRSSRIIRQSSQPEPCSIYGQNLSLSHQTVSLGQLKDQLKNPSDTIAEIAGEALKVILLQKK